MNPNSCDSAVPFKGSRLCSYKLKFYNEKMQFFFIFRTCLATYHNEFLTTFFAEVLVILSNKPLNNFQKNKSKKIKTI
jgi:hypothetical protein